MIRSHNLGFPRIGEKRELKKATEAYWKKEISKEELLEVGSNIRLKNWEKQKRAGLDLIATNDFSFYDQVLDMSIMLSVIPKRFGWNKEQPADIDTLFAIARGDSKKNIAASQMTKWFNTNYHYIVPELDDVSTFNLQPEKLFGECRQAIELGYDIKPVLIGPLTYLRLSKFYLSDQSNEAQLDAKLALLDKLLPVYSEALAGLKKMGVQWVQLDEPIFCLDMEQEEIEAIKKAYQWFDGRKEQHPQILVATYFNDLSDNLDTFCSIKTDGLHVDAISCQNELSTIVEKVDKEKILSLGLVDGRNVWKSDLKTLIALADEVKKKRNENLWVAPTCSLLHSPISIKQEKKLDDEIKNWLCFAEEKLDEVSLLAKFLSGKNIDQALGENEKAIKDRLQNLRIHNKDVKERLSKVNKQDFLRKTPVKERLEKQKQHFDLPIFPTTTIGSFPQTKQVRSLRALLRKGDIDQAKYDTLIKEEIKKTIEMQQQLEIDVLVHGEFERNDMVEYFADKLMGFAFTQHGWVQSYGSRYVKPPIIFGDVKRKVPMTIDWSKYAQSLTKSPVKGMLTGPVTMLQWSFVRDDQPRRDTTWQIALALRDEVADLEKNGIHFIQIDEPAIREGLPLRKKDWKDYLSWAVDAFKLTSSVVEEKTQIHTHMCYSNFNDIITSIARMDADVISIETSKSKMELLQAFVDFNYPAQIGPGVYDVHSARVPTEEEMLNLLKKALKVLDKNQIWVNPDCGLKTRDWPEVNASLKNMVATAKTLRNQHAN